MYVRTYIYFKQLIKNQLLRYDFMQVYVNSNDIHIIVYSFCFFFVQISAVDNQNFYPI